MDLDDRVHDLSQRVAYLEGRLEGITGELAKLGRRGAGPPVFPQATKSMTEIRRTFYRWDMERTEKEAAELVEAGILTPDQAEPFIAFHTAKLNVTYPDIEP